MEQIATLPTFEELLAHVRQLLCAQDSLDPEQTPVTQSLITRSGRICGLFFYAQGPRNVKTYAIWASEQQRILFYDSQGRRYAQTRLLEGPDPAQLSDLSTRHPTRPSAA